MKVPHLIIHKKESHVHKKNQFKKKAVLLIGIFGIFLKCHAQNLEGVYVLSIKNEIYYANIKNDYFQLFSLQDSPFSGASAPSDILNEVGAGKFRLSKKNITFIFDSTIQYYRFYTSDSILCSMQTNPFLGCKNFEVKIRSHVPDYLNNNYLVIEAANKAYRLPIKDGIVISFSDSVVIRNIYLSIMGVGKKHLPFVEYFNTYQYTYFLNEASSEISYIRNTVWESDIKYRQPEANYFRLNSIDYLKKADEGTINFLKRLAEKNEHIKRMVSNWFNM